jgi:serine/threonine protein kinase
MMRQRNENNHMKDHLLAAPNKSSKQGHSWWEKVVVQRSAAAIDNKVDELTESSSFLSEARVSLDALAELQREEIETGKLLGKGTYSSVYEIASFNLDGDLAGPEEDDDENDWNGDSEKVELSQRKALEETLVESSGQRKYAIKHLKPELLKDSKVFESAATDLILEAHFLSYLDHPNILKLRGVAMGGTHSFASTGHFDGFFIVTDRLKETLDDRIRRWKGEEFACTYTQDNSVLTKMELALQVGSALAYLHERRLVYRDLKPHNIGLKEGNVVQLFDFGFCRELPSPGRRPMNKFSEPVVDVNQTPDDEEVLYNMSGKGTLMYMSPEVLGTRNYSCKTDVYSWACIFYEMLTLSRPYSVHSIEHHRQAIHKRKERPPLYLTDIPLPLQQLLQNSWEADISKRFKMREACEHLVNIRHDYFYSDRSRFGEGHGDVCVSSSHFCNIEDMVTGMITDIQLGYEHLFHGIAATKGDVPDPPPSAGISMQSSASKCDSYQAVKGHSASTITADDISVPTRKPSDEGDLDKTAEDNDEHEPCRHEVQDVIRPPLIDAMEEKSTLEINSAAPDAKPELNEFSSMVVEAKDSIDDGGEWVDEEATAIDHNSTESVHIEEWVDAEEISRKPSTSACNSSKATSERSILSVTFSSTSYVADNRSEEVVLVDASDDLAMNGSDRCGPIKKNQTSLTSLTQEESVTMESTSMDLQDQVDLVAPEQETAKEHTASFPLPDASPAEESKFCCENDEDQARPEDIDLSMSIRLVPRGRSGKLMYHRFCGGYYDAPRRDGALINIDRLLTTIYSTTLVQGTGCGFLPP